MKKRTLSLLLAVAMAATLLVPAHATGTGFTDVSNRHYAREAIQFWSERGILSGYPDGTFRPGGSMTRAEMAAMLQNVMGYRDRAENVWTDLPQKAWYTDSILALASRGVLNGTGKGKMSPKTAITRQEAFVMLSNALGVEPQEGAPGFADDGQIASWAVGYVTALKNLGYIHGYAGANTIRPTASITRAETVSLLSQLVPGYVSENGVYSTSCPGTLLVKAGDVTLKDMTVEGDLIVTEAVGEGDVYLEGVTVKGDIVLYGCGENSFHLLPGCKVDKIIVTKTTGGRIRVVNESGETIPLIWVNDGTAGVTLDGDHLGEVVVACDAPVAVKAKSVGTLSVTGNANLTVSKESTVDSLEVASTAGGAKVAVEGKVVAIANDGGANVVGGGQPGGSGSSSGSGSSGGSGSGGGSVTPPTQKTTLSEASIQLLAPAFGEIPDTADPLGAGFTTQIKWLNADGSAPSYRWKVNSGDKDTFTASQAYQAVVTLIPGSRYEFGDSFQVKVVDGNGGTYTPAASEKKGNNWEITLTYPATEAKEYVEWVSVEGNTQKQMTYGEDFPLTAVWKDNLLVDPAGHTCRWYTCDANGGSAQEIAGATGKTYTIPGTTTPGMHYYLYRVTAGGKEYTSAVVEVEVQKPLTAADVPTPTIMDGRVELWNGALVFHIACGNVIRHADLLYRIEPILVDENYNEMPTFNMRVDSDNGHFDSAGNLVVEGDIQDAYSWKSMFESIASFGDQGNLEGTIVNSGVVNIVYPAIRVRVIPVLRTENGEEVLGEKMAVFSTDIPWIIHYVAASRGQLEEALKQQPEGEKELLLQTALTGYPKDGIRLVVDDLESGDTHLELADKSLEVTGVPMGNGNQTYGMQSYFEIPSSGWIAPRGYWDPQTGWTLYFWHYLAEWMDESTTEKIPPELYFCYRPDGNDNGRGVEFYVYQVIPEVVNNSGNQ